MTRHPTRALALCLSALLAACGGSHDPRTDASDPLVTASTTANDTATAKTSEYAVSEQDAQYWSESATLNRSEVQQPSTTSALETAQKSFGTSAKAFVAPSAPLYRFYNINTGAHLFTRDLTERDRTLNTLPQFRYEGAVFSAWASADTGLSPVYRFYNTRTGAHFFTISETEKAQIQASLPEMNLDGVAYYAAKTALAGTTGLYRFYHRQKGFHFYTTSAAERDSIIANLSTTYNYEGVGYYVNASAGNYANALANFAGAYEMGKTDGFGAAARFDTIRGMSFDAFGNLFAVDRVLTDGYYQFNQLRKITPTGQVTTFAGDSYNTYRWSSSALGYQNGTGKNITFDWLYSITTGSNGNIYFGDGRTVRFLTPSATSFDIAGDKTSAGYANGRGSSAKFNEVRGIAIDSNGNIFAADYRNSVIRKITPSGDVSTFVGTQSFANILGNFSDGTGASAHFSGINQITIDSNDNLYTTDGYNHRIRKITPSGVVSTLAGNGNSGVVDGIGTNARFNLPYALAIDKRTNNLYVSDLWGCTVRKVMPSGQVTTVLGIANDCAVSAIDKVNLGSLPGRLAPVGGLAIFGSRLYVASGSAIYWTELP